MANLYRTVLYVLTPELLPISNGQENCPLKTVFIRQALADQCLFSAVLFFAALHVDSLCGRTVSQETLLHRGETMRLLNVNMRSPGEAVSDSTIGAVALLSLGCSRLKGTLLERVNENQTINTGFTESTLHLNALERMVEVRGGLQALGMNGVLHMLVTWYVIKPKTGLQQPCLNTKSTSRQDLSASKVEAFSPRFAQTDCVVSPRTAMTLLNRRVPRAVAEDHLDTVLYSGLSGEIQTILPHLRKLVAIQDSIARTHNATATEIMSLSKLRSSIEQDLLSHQKQPGECRAGMTEEEYKHESCRVATLIYIDTVLRGFRPKFAGPRVLKQRLMDAYEQRRQIDQDIVDEGSSVVLLWILCTGAILSLDDLEKTWFAERISKAITRTGFEMWQEVEECLLGLLWTKFMSDTLCRLVWAEVEEYLWLIRDIAY